MADCEAHFDFWGGLRVRVLGDLSRGAALGYLTKFEHYRVADATGQPGLTFIVEPFETHLTEPFIFNQYQITEGTLARSHKYKIACWKSEIEGLTGLSWTVRLWGNLAAQTMMPHLSMSTLTQLALALRGWVPVHAAAMVQGHDMGNSVVIAGRRGVGKTTLVGRLLRRGYHMVSEDRVFIKKGLVQGLRVPVNMKYDRSDPRIARLPSATRLRLKRNHLLAMATAGYFTLHEPVSLKALIPDELEDHCDLRRLVYLQSGPGLQRITPNAGSIASRIVLGNEFEDPAIIEDVMAYQYCFPGFAGVAGYLWDHDRMRLMQELSRPSVTLADLVVPARPSPSQWDQIVEALTP